MNISCLGYVEECLQDVINHKKGQIITLRHMALLLLLLLYSRGKHKIERTYLLSPSLIKSM